MTTLKDLTDTHESNAAIKVTKLLNNYHWKINANDVLWQYHEPELQKQLGRSKKVYNRLMALEDK